MDKAGARTLGSKHSLRLIMHVSLAAEVRARVLLCQLGNSFDNIVSIGSLEPCLRIFLSLRSMRHLH